MIRVTVPPIDPFASIVDGFYEDGVVTVTRRKSLPDGYFRIGQESGRLTVVHALPDGLIDDGLTGLLRRELIEPGWISGADAFERIFTGIVLSSRPDPEAAWELFYRNTLRRLDAGDPGQFGSIYRHAGDLVSGSLLDLGCCFGFFPLRLRPGRSVRVADVRPGTCELVGRLSARLGLPLPVLCCDAAAVPLPDKSVDTVTLLHLLEHVDEAHGQRMLDEALRLARRRVVIAVPLEDEADACFDHVRTLTLDDLRTLGAGSGCSYDVHEHEGGWLTLSPPPS